MLKYFSMLSPTNIVFYGGPLASLGLSGENPPAMLEAQEPQVQSLGQEDPLEEGLATHSSIPARRIPRTEEPGGLQSTGLRRVGHG